MSCTTFDFEEEISQREESILRKTGDTTYALHEPKKKEREPYSWENEFIAGHRRITKEHFRCKGSSHNLPLLMTNRYGETVYIADCGGVERHTLPLRDDQEYIFPVLIDVLNHIQEKTGKDVVITCGHRCPQHNTYAEALATTSKHMIGAEVDFYVAGVSPQKIVEFIIDYYQGQPEEYSRFYRYEKKTNVSTKPWYNKEIFIKLFKENEGRDMDNSHTHPYLSIQVRYDRSWKKWVSYNWHEAYSNYKRE